MNRDESLATNLCSKQIVLSLIFVSIVIVSFIFYLGVPASAQNNSNKDISLANLIKQGSPHLGSLSAPVTIIDFSDFQCYLCGRYVKNTEPKINETYIQTGKANLVFKHLPNRGTDSIGAAIAAQCTTIRVCFGNFITSFIKIKARLTRAGLTKIT